MDEPQVSVPAIIIGDDEGENKMEESDVGSTGSLSGLTTDRNEEELDDADGLSNVSDTGWETDLEMEGGSIIIIKLKRAINYKCVEQGVCQPQVNTLH